MMKKHSRRELPRSAIATSISPAKGTRWRKLWRRENLPKRTNDGAKALRERILEIRHAINGHVVTPTETALPSPELLDRAILLAHGLIAHVGSQE
jgi:hypothetical protein